mmetsp:Transcript_28949/g.46422  ORF Transcript_28949/g.46422 Transcript_28949/m.46422 type:complete len:233 (+) Transcript_28949:2114-2812(+)
MTHRSRRSSACVLTATATTPAVGWLADALDETAGDKSVPKVLMSPSLLRVPRSTRRPSSDSITLTAGRSRDGCWLAVLAVRADLLDSSFTSQECLYSCLKWSSSGCVYVLRPVTWLLKYTVPSAAACSLQPTGVGAFSACSAIHSRSKSRIKSMPRCRAYAMICPAVVSTPRFAPAVLMAAITPREDVDGAATSAAHPAAATSVRGMLRPAFPASACTVFGEVRDSPNMVRK